MGRVICVANEKGGVGKTTIAVNFAVEGARAGFKVMLVDTDPQASATDFAAARPEGLPQYRTIQMQQPILHREVPELGADFDLVLIDVGGRDTKTFRSALGAGDEVIIPIKPGPFDVWGTDGTLKFLEELALARQVRWSVVFNLVKPNTRIAGEALEKMGDYGVGIIRTWLYDRTDWSRAAGEGLGVREHRPRSKAAQELKALCDEIQLVKKPRQLQVLQGGQS